MSYNDPLKMKISLSEDKASNDEEYYVLAIEFPDDDVKAYVMSESTLFPNRLLEFKTYDSAAEYAKVHFTGLTHFIDKKVRR